MSIGEVVILVGASGCGKTGAWRFRYAEHQVINMDKIRMQLTDNVLNRSMDPIAKVMAISLFEYRVQAGLPTVLDDVNSRRDDRAPFLAAARRFNRPTIAVVFHTPLQVCQERQVNHNHTRQRRGQPYGRSVAPEVVARQFSEIGEHWHEMSLEVDCTVHVAPEGTTQQVRVGDIPARRGERLAWLAELPAVAGVGQLPWVSPYAAAAVAR